MPKHERTDAPGAPNPSPKRGIGCKDARRYWREHAKPPRNMETAEVGRVAALDVWDLVIALDSIATGSNVGIEIEKLRQSGAIYRAVKYVDELRNRVEATVEAPEVPGGAGADE
jgi:hypothetical protein